jgi:hypothetical protein
LIAGLTTAFGAGSVPVGDFNGDGKPDIAVGKGTASNLLVFPGMAMAPSGLPSPALSNRWRDLPGRWRLQ